MTTGELLGRTHPLTRATRRVEAARQQLLVGLTVITAIVLFALELIIAGDEDLPLDELEPVRRRLRDPRGRLQLALSLQRCLGTAERWDAIAPHRRPVGNMRLLLPHEDLVRDIARLLRVAHPPRVRGVALCERLLTDGVTSPLFREDGDVLRREVGRIRFALDALGTRAALHTAGPGVRRLLRRGVLACARSSDSRCARRGEPTAAPRSVTPRSCRELDTLGDNRHTAFTLFLRSCECHHQTFSSR